MEFEDGPEGVLLEKLLAEMRRLLLEGVGGRSFIVVENEDFFTLFLLNRKKSPRPSRIPTIPAPPMAIPERNEQTLTKIFSVGME